MDISFAVLGPLPFIEIGALKIPSYPLMIALASLITLTWGYYRCIKSKFERDIFFEIYILLIISGFIGARLFHVLYEAPEYYLQDPKQIFYLWQGGFVYYGGFIGSLLVCSVFVKRIVPKRFPDVHPINYSILSWYDFFFPLASLGYGLGRLACFVNGCCYGKICDLPWSLSAKTINLNTGEITYLPRHPTQLYALVWELTTLCFLLLIQNDKIFSNNKSITQFKRKPGALFFLWLSLHSIGRIIMESFRDDFRGSFISSVSVSTAISIFLLIISSTLIFKMPKIKIDNKFE